MNWINIKIADGEYLNAPSNDRPVLVKLQHFNSKEVRFAVLKKVDEDDCDWRTVDGNSEISYDWNVIRWCEIYEPREDSGVENIVSDEELDKAWGNSNFGSMTKRDVVKFAVLKCASGYYQGYTSKIIANELGLINDKYEITPKGRQYLWAAFNTSNL